VDPLPIVKTIPSNIMTIHLHHPAWIIPVLLTGLILGLLIGASGLALPLIIAVTVLFALKWGAAVLLYRNAARRETYTAHSP